MLRIRPLYQSLYGPNGTAQRKKSPQLTRMWQLKFKEGWHNSC
jgi:hypothetical protein